jgi:hypothetical protein
MNKMELVQLIRECINEEISKFKGNTIRLTEGGNVFKNADNTPATTRINKEDVLPTIKWLESITGLPLVNNTLGSTGIAAQSGDLDLAVDVNKISKQELETILKQWTAKNGLDHRLFIKKTGDSVHFKTPIVGKTGEYVQTDFMFSDNLEFTKWRMRGTSPTSKYKAQHRNILISSIATSLGLKWSYFNGLVSRESGKVITDNPDEIAEILLGPGHTDKDLISVESVLDAIKDLPNRDKLIADAKETLSRLYNVNIE